jgi:hypothetical protein
MRKLFLALLTSSLLLTGCSNDESKSYPNGVDDSGIDYGIPASDWNPGAGGYSYDPRTIDQKLTDFNSCISGGLGNNAVEIKETIDNCSNSNLTLP